MTARSDKRGRQPNHENLRTIDALSPRDRDTAHIISDKTAIPADTPTRKDGEHGTKTAKETEKMTTWQRTESLLRMVSIMAVTSSAVLAAWKYYESQVTERKSHSIEFMNKWQSSDVRDAYTRLRRSLEQFITEAGDLREGLKDQELAQAKSELGRLAVTYWTHDSHNVHDGWQDDIEAVVNFYSEIEFCIRAQVCDVVLLDDYFEDNVTGFWTYFQYYANLQRQELYPDYAAAVERLVATMSQ